MIEISDLYKRFSDDRPYVLADLNMTVASGELVFIYGRSGAGKTTLLRTMFALEKPDRGRILLAGRNISALSPSLVPYLRRNIGFIFQNPSLVPTQSVFDNVSISLQIRGLSKSEVERRTNEALDAVGLADRAPDKTVILSGGEQQRVSMAKAILAGQLLFWPMSQPGT